MNSVIKKSCSKHEELFACIYCKCYLKQFPLNGNGEYYYYYCNTCYCGYIENNSIIAKIDIGTIINGIHYTVRLDLIENKTYVSSYKLLFTCDKCMEISPKNIHDTIQALLIMI